MYNFQKCSVSQKLKEQRIFWFNLVPRKSIALFGKPESCIPYSLREPKLGHPVQLCSFVLQCKMIQFLGARIIHRTYCVCVNRLLVSRTTSQH